MEYKWLVASECHATAGDTEQNLDLRICNYCLRWNALPWLCEWPAIFAGVYTLWPLSFQSTQRCYKETWGHWIFCESRSTIYNVKIVNKSYDGNLGILGTRKQLDYSILIISCYLSLEDFPWWRDDDRFCSNLLSEIDCHSYVDCVYVHGEINGRVENMKSVHELDRISTQISTDYLKNEHGKCCGPRPVLIMDELNLIDVAYPHQYQWRGNLW